MGILSAKELLYYMKCCIGIHVPETPFRSVADVLILMELEWRQIIFLFLCLGHPVFVAELLGGGAGKKHMSGVTSIEVK